MYWPVMDEIVSACPPGATAETEGEVVADSEDSEDKDGRGVRSGGTESGIAIDFQYVSTAPPISSVTPLNGRITLISKSTYIWVRFDMHGASAF